MIIIIGILAAIAIPVFLAQREKAVIATCESDTRNAAEAAVLYAADQPNGDFTGLDTLAELEAQGFNQTEGYTTTVGGAPDDAIIQTTCPAPAGGTADWTTVDGQFRGEVVYNAP